MITPSGLSWRRFSLVGSTDSYSGGGSRVSDGASHSPTRRRLAPVYDLAHARLLKVSGHRFTQSELAETAAGLRRLLGPSKQERSPPIPELSHASKGPSAPSKRLPRTPQVGVLYLDDR